MYYEINSSSIIAAILENTVIQDKISISYKDIRNIASKLEDSDPKYYTTSDLMSIDDFHRIFYNNVKMEKEFLVITNITEIHFLVKKLLPSQEIIDLVGDFIRKKD